MRDRTELPIHDRETDVIVGIVGLVFAYSIQAVLLVRYSWFFHLLRLDLVALWFFALSSAVVLFGVRPIYRFRWAWLLGATMFVLPYHISVVLLGGTRTAAGLVTVGIAAVATGIAVGRTTRRVIFGAIAAAVVGGLFLAGMAHWAPSAPLFAFQAVPALTATIVVVGALLLRTLRAGSFEMLERTVEPLAANQVWSSLPVVAVVAAALAVAPVPVDGPVPHARLDDIPFGKPLAAPAGWHLTDTQRYPWVSKVYGEGAVLVRQKFVANTGNPAWDKLSRPRAIVVDSVSSSRPFSFTTYPPRVLYRGAQIRLSDQIRLNDKDRVPLGGGVVAVLVNVIDDDILISWDALHFTWGNREFAQQVTVFTSDNHEPDAPFPSPTGALLPTLDTLVTVLLRGNAAVTNDAPAFKDVDMLAEFGHGLVAAQLPTESAHQ
ncbi:hypothetical protein [Mycolicibacterium parafortuitum]|uniref:Uncharacterized protein n=1 Tax=Mycolicibacterium parafortuitum TaxID=39692 RepID=A0A375YK43_MYCPF|nr:hypothetical protein [Mycolicibacterium parafortuitum]ORB25267.1 hypothetical protein BST38_27950 [Mycolicibacterium parafortuitum]SRX81528.1 hypothetical protein MPP7335_03280 [Mycolicibacterium parafortuitum]